MAILPYRNSNKIIFFGNITKNRVAICDELKRLDLLINITDYWTIQDWSKGITIGFDFYINRNGPNSVYRPLIYIGGDPNNTSLPHFALVHLANTGFSYIFYVNGVATNQSFVVLYDGRIVINILPSGVVNLYIASALAYSNNLLTSLSFFLFLSHSITNPLK
jgi:hypothetical protein